MPLKHVALSVLPANLLLLGLLRQQSQGAVCLLPLSSELRQGLW